MLYINPNDIINRERLSPLQWLIFAMGFLVFFCDGLDTGIIGFIAPQLLEDWGISKAELAPVMSAALVGMCIGALISGPLADHLGRKGVILTSSFVFSVFTIACGFASSSSELLLFRFITGLGLGAAMPNISTLVSEYMPAKRKAFLTGLAGCGFMLGISFGGVLSALLLDPLGWAKVMILGGILPLLLVIVLFLALPESTQYLIKKQKIKQAKIILEKIQGQAFPADIHFKHAAHELASDDAPLALLWKRYALSSLFLWICCFFSLMVFYLLTSWMPTILKTAGFSTQQFSLIAAIFPFGGVIGALFMGWFMDKVRPSLVVQLAYAAAFVLFMVAGLLHSNILLLGLSIFCIGALLAGAQSSLLPLAALSYPTVCRAVGVSWMHGIGRIGAILGALFGALIFSFDLSLAAIFYLLAIPTFISSLALLIRRRYELPITTELK